MKSDVDNPLCFSCENHLITDDFGNWRYLWYNRYCKAAPKSEEEILEEKEYEEEGLGRWCKLTNNGALCHVPYTTVSFPSRHEYEDYEHCRDVKNCNYMPKPSKKMFEKLLGVFQ